MQLLLYRSWYGLFNQFYLSRSQENTASVPRFTYFGAKGPAGIRLEMCVRKRNDDQ